MTSAATPSLAATTTATIASPGLILKCQAGQAIYIRRWVSGAATGLVGANFVLYFHGNMMVQNGAQPFTVGSGNASNDSEMLVNATTNSVANAQTLSDMSITGMLRDDWHEFDDYSLQPAFPPIGAALGLQAFWRLRNTDAAAHNINVTDSCLYEIWQSAEVLSG